MARVLLFTADLLFGSRVQGQLEAAGEHVERLNDAALVRERLLEPEPPALLVADLTDPDLGAVELVGSLAARSRPPALGYYSHVESDVRARAEAAGYELVVARSRFAREGAALVQRLAASRDR
jgi:CheY-like chemotaxis protein